MQADGDIANGPGGALPENWIGGKWVGRWTSSDAIGRQWRVFRAGEYEKQGVLGAPVDN